MTDTAPTQEDVDRAIEELRASGTVPVRDSLEAPMTGQMPTISPPVPAEPVPVPSPVQDDPAPAPLAPVTQRTVRTVGGVVGVDAYGGIAWPPQPSADATEPWDDRPIVVNDTTGQTFATSEARLTAEGFRWPRPDIEEVVRQREALRTAATRLMARGVQDQGLIQLAVRYADADQIVEAVERNGINAWMAGQIGSPGSYLSGLSYDLEKALLKMCWTHAQSLRRSLVGWDTPSANRLRQTIDSLERNLSAPEPGFHAYVIYG